MSATSTATRTSTYAPPAATGRPTTRIASLDLIRGVVMVLMAIDHVRVYSGVPAGGPTPGVFFTRWVTHFCAPSFVFLAGTGAFLLGQRLGDTKALARHLLTRGLLLVALELTLLHVAWTFSVDFTHLLAGVIWMLGWCMVLMAALVQLPPAAVGVIGLILIFGQNLLTPLAGLTPHAMQWFWQFLYLGGEVNVGPTSISILYVLVPWIGVMAAGYGFGMIVVRGDDERHRLSLRIGLAATALFAVIAAIIVARNPAPAGAPPAFLRALNQQKYPASPLFLMMTLGPMIALIPLAEKARGWWANVVTTFGRVPMFYYLLHIPLIHAVALVTWLVRDGTVGASRFDSAPYVSIPPTDRWSLGLLYLVFAICVALLYVPCRWYAARKATRPAAWMRYI
ncbi:MAG TPA: heparan-alpha-glucosaminide N-acetyltransferase domain-containing protein [Gemmatimonadaceae bacterium]|jgi:uncharacterized membrane protein